MDKHRQYLRWFAGTALGVIGVLGALNLLVDPCDRFGLNRLGVYVIADREVKSAEFPRFAPDAVLLGNSRAAMIDVSRLSGHRFFNAAFPGASIEELHSFIEHYVKDQKLVVLGLDAYQFGLAPQPITDPFKPLTFRRAMDYILSLRHVEYSVRTMAKHLAGEPSDFASDGSYAQAKWEVRADRIDEELARRRMREYRDALAHYQLDPARLEVLRAIRDTLKQRGIPLRVCLAPTHADVWQGLEGTSGLSIWPKVNTRLRKDSSVMTQCIFVLPSACGCCGNES